MNHAHAIALTLCVALLPPVASAQGTAATGRIEQSSQTTPEEMIHHVDEALAQMRAGVAEVTELMEAAERGAQAVLIQCLSSKLTTMRALLVVSKSSGDSMKQALSTGERDLAKHEHRKVTIALSKSLQLKLAADGCQASRSAGTGTTIDVVEGALGTDDETEAQELEPGLDAPPPTSQFQ